jgi:hypothetical protein
VVLGREPPEWAEVCDWMGAFWVEGAEAAVGGEAASERIHGEGSHHAGKRAKNTRVPPGSPRHNAPPMA